MDDHTRVWLDDVRPAPDGWLWARNYDEAIHLLQTCNVREISLDHDLGMEQTAVSSGGIAIGVEKDARTGYDVACWIEERAYMGDSVPDVIRCHSANPEGRRRINLVIGRIAGFRPKIY